MLGPADLGGSLVAGVGFRVASERSDLRVLFPLRQTRNQSHRAGNSAVISRWGLLPAKSKLAGGCRFVG